MLSNAPITALSTQVPSVASSPPPSARSLPSTWAMPVPTRVFVYGSLLRGLHNSHHLLNSPLVLPGARTSSSNYVLIDSGNSYLYAVHAANAGDRVQSTLLGEVYSVNEQALESLDKLEEHPDYYRRELIQVDGESEPAWMYLIVDKDVLSNLDKYQVVDPPGDWRTHHVGKAVESWPATKRTATSAGPHAVFSYGSNGLEQLRERCQNEKIEGQPATLANAVRVFAGASARWDGGGVASIVPCPGLVVHGNIAHLSDGELKLLDGFERGFQGLSDDPYEADGVYRRQDLVAKLEATGELIEACAYVKCDLTWVKPPSAKYMNACRTNVDLFWPGRDIPIEIRDGVGRLREDE